MAGRVLPNVVIVMGVSGSGKTTVGQRLAAQLGFTFVDADDFHDAEAISHMREGTGLTDSMREPWLLRVRTAVSKRIADGERVVLACSALKATYRDALRPPAAITRFVYLKVSPAVLSARLGRRDGHFAGPALLDSQLAAFEEPSPEEALVVDGEPPVEAVVEAIARNVFPGEP